MNVHHFRALKVEILKLLYSLHKLDRQLSEKRNRAVDVGQWEDLRTSDIVLRIFPALLNYVDKEDRSQYESLEKLNVKLHYLAKRLEGELLGRVHSNSNQLLADQINKKLSDRHVETRVEDFITIMKDYVNGDPTVMNAAIREFNKLLSLVKDKPDLVPYLAEDKNKPVRAPHIVERLNKNDVQAEKSWNFDAYVPLDNMYDRPLQPSKKVFQYTVDDPFTGKHTNSLQLMKSQCVAMEMKHMESRPRIAATIFVL